MPPRDAAKNAFPDRPDIDAAKRARPARDIHFLLLAIAIGGLSLGLGLYLSGEVEAANLAWAAGTIPVTLALAVSIVSNLRKGRIGVDAVALVSMSAALALHQSLAGVVVAIMYAGGNVLENVAVGRAQRDLQLLTDRAPRFAHRVAADAVERIDVGHVLPGDVLLVRAGEIIPVDGIVLDAKAVIDESVVTGEPLPVERGQREIIVSGTTNAGESFTMRATACAADSAYAGIVHMVSSAQAGKSPFIRMADRYAFGLLPVTLIVAAAAWFWSGDPVRALAVLVVATPCPLILAAPVAFISGIARAARRGILVKGGASLEALAHVRTAMFDKTGTLTVGGARLIGIDTAPGIDSDAALRLCASLEQASHHVLAATIVAAARQRGLDLSLPGNVEEVRGSGLRGLVDGKRVSAGSFDLVAGETEPQAWAERAMRRAGWLSALTVFLRVDDVLAAVFLLGDEIRPEASSALRDLRLMGVERQIMVTGDHADAARAAASGLHLDDVYTKCTPSRKIALVKEEKSRAPVMMVGDGINDAPALACADVGIAMGARGVSASSEAADMVILVEDLNRVAEAMAIARRTRTIAWQSIVVGLALSGIAMGFAAMGKLPPIAGALLQEGIDVAVILNALRALRGRKASRSSSIARIELARIRAQHDAIAEVLRRLERISLDLDGVAPDKSRDLLAEASTLVSERLLAHELDDDRRLYPSILASPESRPLLAVLTQAHGDIFNLARILSMIEQDTRQPLDQGTIREAQRTIDALVVLVSLHNRQENVLHNED